MNHHSPLLQHLIRPDWPAPEIVQAASTTRLGGVSKAPFDTFNLGYHPGDAHGNVTINRKRLAEALALPDEPVWLKQVHGNTAIDAASVKEPAKIEADASVARQAGVVCAVMTADCLPVLLCSQEGTEVAAIHAGWRGLARGVIAAAVTALDTAPQRLMAWLGPAIGPQVYEVGHEVRDCFLALDGNNAGCFQPSPAGRWLADLQALARRQLAALGITAIYSDKHCTYTHHERFFSYRRDGSSGRMASLIWIER